MKSKLLTASILLLAAMQVACSDDDKGLTQAQLCAKNPACWQRYTAPQAVKAITGPAAVAGFTQVAAKEEGTNLQKGDVRVPNTKIVPASISDQDIATYAKRVNTTLQAMSADPDFRLVNGSRTLLAADTKYVPNYQPSSASSSSAAEITVARLPAAQPQQLEPQPVAAPQAPDLNSVFSQPEARGAR